ncbi:MAG: exodeoxyribonuclease VII large subunit [Firmicutes bacterium]|nr:exodeoxyribonuclease VII large subunit [Bacillota bacterium]
MSPKTITVSQLTYALKRLIEDNFLLEGVWVRGEISNFTAHSSGHLYFTLKDAGACIRCVMFKSQARGLKFKPADGHEVLISGRIGVYEKSGQYQLYVEEMTPSGLGSLYQAFLQLKEKLEREGLFDPERKRKLPFLPQKIGVITSPTGAAVRDIIKILRRRRPNVDILIFPAQVQGEEAPDSLIKALEEAARFQNLDLIIIGRGGGSLEELWAFNDERLARAIADFPKPVISAVGHETDFTIADFVADLRAPTPSGAAELAVPDQQDLSRQIRQYKTRLFQTVNGKLQHERRILQRITQSRALSFPKQLLLNTRRQEVDLLNERLVRQVKQILTLKRERFLKVLGQLDTLSPLATLQRGYSIVQKEDGVFVKDAAQVEPGELLKITLASGKINCEVLSKES